MHERRGRGFGSAPQTRRLRATLGPSPNGAVSPSACPHPLDPKHAHSSSTLASSCFVLLRATALVQRPGWDPRDPHPLLTSPPLAVVLSSRQLSSPHVSPPCLWRHLPPPLCAAADCVVWFINHLFCKEQMPPPRWFADRRQQRRANHGRGMTALSGLLIICSAKSKCLLPVGSRTGKSNDGPITGAACRPPFLPWIQGPWILTN